MSRLRIVLAAGERQRRLNNSVVYAQLLFNAQRSPVVYGLKECEAYVRDVVEHASPDETLFHAIQLNSPARRNALRHARLPRGDVGFVGVGLRLVMQRLREASRHLQV